MLVGRVGEVGVLQRLPVRGEGVAHGAAGGAAHGREHVVRAQLLRLPVEWALLGLGFWGRSTRLVAWVRVAWVRVAWVRVAWVRVRANPSPTHRRLTRTGASTVTEDAAIACSPPCCFTTAAAAATVVATMVVVAAAAAAMAGASAAAGEGSTAEKPHSG